MQTIPYETIEATYNRMIRLNRQQVRKIIRRIGKNQPVILAYLLNSFDKELSEREQDLLLFFGALVWEVMREAEPLQSVTPSVLEEIEEWNIQLMQRVENKFQRGKFMEVISFLEDHPQSELLQFILEIIMEDDEDNVIREESQGLIFFAVKVVVDCLNQGEFQTASTFSCGWCETQIGSDSQHVSVGARLQEQNVGQFMGNRISIYLPELDKNLMAIVPTPDSEAAKRGNDIVFVVCSDDCANALTHALQNQRIEVTFLEK